MRKLIFSALVLWGAISCTRGTDVRGTELEFVKDTFININVKERVVEFSFDGTTDYDILLFTLPLKVYYNGFYLTIRNPHIFVNPENEVGVAEAQDIYSAEIPDTFSSDSFFNYFQSRGGIQEGRVYYFKLFSDIDSLIFLKASGDTLIINRLSAYSSDTIIGYRDAYVNLNTASVVNPISPYDSTYHIRFIDGVPHLNIYYDWGVSVSDSLPLDTTLISQYGDAIHENDDGDYFYTDRYVSHIGDGWYTYSGQSVVPLDRVYYVRKPDGTIFVFEVLDYYNEDGESGYFTIRFGKLR